MCSIMGYCGSGVALSLFSDGFSKTESRGPDDTKVIDTGKGLLGFHRLAIMGLTPDGMQPFEMDGSYVVCNGEIYGFEKLKEELLEKGYSFKSESDCEIILPLYREYGVEMFKMLDAEFACVIFDGNSKEYIAARDPIGIRPLYYGYDDKKIIVFASEPKNLVGLVDKIMPFPPPDIIIKTVNSYAITTLLRLTHTVTMTWKRCAGTLRKNLLQVWKKGLLQMQR